MNTRKIKIFSFLVLASFLAAGCATSRKSRTVTTPKVSDEIYLQDVCREYKLSCHWDSIAQKVTIKASGRNIKAIVGSDIILAEDEKIVLSAPVTLRNSAVIVPADFIRALMMVQPKKAEKDDPRRLKKSVHKIIVDPGHGGKDPGAVGYTGMHEKHVALDISRKLKHILEREGFDVHLTRNSDHFITLHERTEAAARMKADLFISVHANAHPKRGVRGVEVYTLKDLNRRDRMEDNRVRNEQLLYKQFNMKRGHRDVETILSDMLYEYKQSESLQLAQIVTDNTSRALKAKNLGRKSARFYVLRNTLIPAVLVEVGFLSNPKEEKLLKNGGYRQRAAAGIARSVLGYINGN